MKFNKKGQGALEYLLLIGGAVLIAVIVIALLVGMGSSSRTNTEKTTEQLTQQEVVIPVNITGASCTGTTTHYTIMLSELNTADFNYYLYADGVAGDQIFTNPDDDLIGGATQCADGVRVTVMKKSLDTNGIAMSTSYTINN